MAQSEPPIKTGLPGALAGENVSALALRLHNYWHHPPFLPPIQIFATDVNEIVLEKARQGEYAASASISAVRLRRFFVRVNSSYQVSKTIRRMCVFAKQDVTADPPFSKLDLVMFRDLLIYLRP